MDATPSLGATMISEVSSYPQLTLDKWLLSFIVKQDHMYFISKFGDMQNFF